MSDTCGHSIGKIAEYLNVGKETDYAWMEKRNLPPHKVSRIRKIQRRDVDSWVKSDKAADRRNGANE